MSGAVIGAAIVLGILFLGVILREPPGKPLFSVTLKVIALVLFVLFGAYVVFTSMYTPMDVPYIVGQALGCVLLIGVFVGIAVAIKKRRDRRQVS